MLIAIIDVVFSARLKIDGILMRSVVVFHNYGIPIRNADWFLALTD